MKLVTLWSKLSLGIQLLVALVLGVIAALNISILKKNVSICVICFLKLSHTTVQQNWKYCCPLKCVLLPMVKCFFVEYKLTIKG